MVDKHKLPRIQSNADTNYSLARSIGRINFEIQRLQSKEKQNRWSSSNYVRYKETTTQFKKNQKKNGLRKRSESLVNSDEALSRQGQERRADNSFLKRYNSEPFLQQSYEEFSVQATPLKLNNRNKEENRKRNDSTGGFLPPVFLDPKLSADNLMASKQFKLETAKTIKMIREFENRQKELVKNRAHVGQKQSEKLPNGSKTTRKVESKIPKDAEESVEDKTVKPRKGLLPKRRLSEQVDSYEVSRTFNDKAFPRKITIRTSKSCPTIVIHECGDNDDTFTDIRRENTKNVEYEGDIGNIGEDDLTVDRSRTTSLVACWKPKQSVVSEK